MKKLISLLLLLCSYLCYGNDIEKIREIYFFSDKDENICDSISLLLKDMDTENNLVLAYRGANTLLYCTKTNNVFKKFSYFEKGKYMIEQAIKNEPKNVEIAFLRYINQKNTPWYLNYKKNIKEDYKFIIQNINIINDQKFRNKVIETLKTFKW